MKHGDFVLICVDHREPWIPTKRACGPIVTDVIGKHEDLAEWDEYAEEMDVRWGFGVPPGSGKASPDE